MDDETQSTESAQSGEPVGGVRNMGEPLLFTDVEPLAGFSAAAAQAGQKVGVITKFALTSDEPRFHRFVESFADVIRHMAQLAGAAVSLRRASTVLLVLKPERRAELWVDTAAVSLLCTVKRAIKARTAVFEGDVADITGMSFPCVTFGKEDKVLCLFRQDWRFGFAFDMNPDGKLDLNGFTTTLGSLYRTMRYRHLYDAIQDEALFARLVTAGWFPFSEIITTEFRELLRQCEAGFDLSDIERQIVSKFDDSRMQNIRERWIAKPHFAAKAGLLDAAIAAFLNKQPVAVIKILLTEIEGFSMTRTEPLIVNRVPN